LLIVGRVLYRGSIVSDRAKVIDVSSLATWMERPPSFA
jgi:hypothetical protein